MKCLMRTVHWIGEPSPKISKFDVILFNLVNLRLRWTCGTSSSALLFEFSFTFIFYWSTPFCLIMFHMNCLIFRFLICLWSWQASSSFIPTLAAFFCHTLFELPLIYQKVKMKKIVKLYTWTVDFHYSVESFLYLFLFCPTRAICFVSGRDIALAVTMLFIYIQGFRSLNSTKKTTITIFLGCLLSGYWRYFWWE